MFDLVKTWLASSLIMTLTAAPALASDRPFNLGKIASKEEVSGWDIDVRPDGLGAPVGMGNATVGMGNARLAFWKVNEHIHTIP